MSVFPAVRSVVPHGPPMILLDRIVDAGEGFVRCEVDIRPESLFVHDGRVRNVVGLEYMAQCIAVYAGLQSQRAQQPVRAWQSSKRDDWARRPAYFDERMCRNTRTFRPQRAWASWQV